jgi:excisionase family DNA binding protein
MNDNRQIEPLLVSPSEAARLLGVSRSLLYQFISDKRFGIVPISFGRKKLYSVQELRAYVQAGCPAMEKWQQAKGASR